MTTSHLTDETTSQSTKPPKNGGKVAGYNPAKDAGQVIGYSHPTKLPKTATKWLVMLRCSEILVTANLKVTLH